MWETGKIRRPKKKKEAVTFVLLNILSQQIFTHDIKTFVEAVTFLVSWVNLANAGYDVNTKFYYSIANVGFQCTFYRIYPYAKQSFAQAVTLLLYALLFTFSAGGSYHKLTVQLACAG